MVAKALIDYPKVLLIKENVFRCLSHRKDQVVKDFFQRVLLVATALLEARVEEIKDYWAGRVK